MDTLSRDSNSSGSILPLVGVIAGGLALVLAIVALVKVTSVQKNITAHDGEFDAKISAIESEVRSAATNADNAVKGLRAGVQNALDDVGKSLTATGERLAKVEEAQKARPVAAAAPAAKNGTTAGAAAPAPTGVVDAQGNYTVAKGDTLSGIARKFGTRVDSIEAENPGLNATRMLPGQKIKIPRR
jgi:LysM repeat protein